jgi:hypothetical protein
MERPMSDPTRDPTRRALRRLERRVAALEAERGDREILARATKDDHRAALAAMRAERDELQERNDNQAKLIFGAGPSFQIDYTSPMAPGRLLAVIAERDEWRRKAALEREGRKLAAKTIASVLGGEVEGRPTHAVNYLQRARALVAIEDAVPQMLDRARAEGRAEEREMMALLEEQSYERGKAEGEKHAMEVVAEVLEVDPPRDSDGLTIVMWTRKHRDALMLAGYDKCADMMVELPHGGDVELDPEDQDMANWYREQMAKARAEGAAGEQWKPGRCPVVCGCCDHIGGEGRKGEPELSEPMPCPCCGGEQVQVDTEGTVHPVHGILWAARQMQAGRRVRRKAWPPGAMIDDPCTRARLYHADLLATDWQLVEEPDNG